VEILVEILSLAQPICSIPQRIGENFSTWLKGTVFPFVGLDWRPATVWRLIPRLVRLIIAIQTIGIIFMLDARCNGMDSGSLEGI